MNKISWECAFETEKKRAPSAGWRIREIPDCAFSPKTHHRPTYERDKCRRFTASAFLNSYITHALKQGTLFAIGLSEDRSIPYLKDKEKGHEEMRSSDHTCDYGSAALLDF